MSESPPQLVVSQQPYKRCEECIYFHVIGRAHRELDGKCYAYEAFVRADFVCDTFLSIRHEAKQHLSYNGHEQTEPVDTTELDM